MRVMHPTTPLIASLLFILLSTSIGCGANKHPDLVVIETVEVGTDILPPNV